MSEIDEEVMNDYVEREVITFRVMPRIVMMAPGLHFKAAWLHDAFTMPLHRLVKANGTRAKENTVFAWRFLSATLVAVTVIAAALMPSWEPLVVLMALFAVAFGCISMSVGDGCGDLPDHQAGLSIIDTKENLEWFYERIRRVLPTHAAIHAVNYYPAPTSHDYNAYVEWVEFLYNVKEL